MEMDASQDSLRVIANASRVLTKAEHQYCMCYKAGDISSCVGGPLATSAPIWGVVVSLCVHAHHNSLQWLESFKKPQGEVAWWLDILVQYDFQIQHRPRAKHGNTDALSRLPCKQCGLEPHPHTSFDKELPIEDGNCDDVSNVAMAADNRLDSDPKKGQKEDSDLQQVISWLLNNNIPPALPTIVVVTGYKLSGHRKTI